MGVGLALAAVKFHACLLDGCDGGVLEPAGAVAAADAHRTGAAVVHRTRGVCAGLRQGEPQRGDLFQGHEEDAQPRVVHPVVQPAQLFRGHASLLGNFTYSWRPFSLGPVDSLWRVSRPIRT